jgi:hypothetical protein
MSDERFQEDLSHLLNEWGWDARSNTPDYKLAEWVTHQLRSLVALKGGE